MSYKVKIDICAEIKAGDTVEIVPEYTYMMGTNTRIKDYFKVRAGEVVIQKMDNSSEDKDECTVIKTSRAFIEKNGNT